MSPNCQTAPNTKSRLKACNILFSAFLNHFQGQSEACPPKRPLTSLLARPWLLFCVLVFLTLPRKGPACCLRPVLPASSITLGTACPAWPSLVSLASLWAFGPLYASNESCLFSQIHATPCHFVHSSSF